MKYYELKLAGDNLLATPCEAIDEYADDVTDGFEYKMFNGRRVAYFFERFSDGEYDIAWGQDLWIKGGRVILPLNDIECLTSDSPIDRFSWEDDADLDSPNHKVILNELSI